METSEEYIERMLDSARELLAEIVSLSNTYQQVDTDDVYDALNDKISDFKNALGNALEEIENF